MIWDFRNPWFVGLCVSVKRHFCLYWCSHACSRPRASSFFKKALLCILMRCGVSTSLCVNECLCQRVLDRRRRALYHLKRAIYHCQRALQFWKRGLVCTLTRCGATKKCDAVCCNVLPMRCSRVQLTCLCVLQCVVVCCLRDATHLMQCVACYWVWAHQIH